MRSRSLTASLPAATGKATPSSLLENAGALPSAAHDLKECRVDGRAAGAEERRRRSEREADLLPGLAVPPRDVDVLRVEAAEGSPAPRGAGDR
ncbi:hypothetical protein DIPPA_18621 [Diplonema papillatum]|nr:hypothetical protein DIPPA_18621 [Diplonema papillatum]